MDGLSPYILRTQSTRRARNGLEALDERLRQNALALSQADEAVEVAREGRASPGMARSSKERARQSKREARAVSRRERLAAHGDALARDRERLAASIEERDGARGARVPGRGKRLHRMPTAERTRTPTERDRSFAVRGDMPFDPGLCLWGTLRASVEEPAAPPTFGDAALDRLAAIWSVPGLAHLLVIQIERQMVFSGLEAFVADHRDFATLALDPRLRDCEIDAEVALALMEGDRGPAERLVAAAVGLRRTAA